MDDRTLLHVAIVVALAAIVSNAYTLTLVQRDVGPATTPANAAPPNAAGAAMSVYVTCEGCGIDGMAGEYAESVCEGPGFAYKGQHPDTYTCFLRGTDWRIYQTGCGWEVQEQVAREMYPGMAWERSARTYTGQCAAMPEEQFTVEGLVTGTTYDGSGRTQSGIALSRDPRIVRVTCEGCGIDGMAGVYTESVCEAPGFAYKGQHPDTYPCFLKGGDWRIYQTGCGWEVQQRMEGDELPRPGDDPRLAWERRARTYTGQCSDMPEEQYEVDGLTTSTTYDGAGRAQTGIDLARDPAPITVSCEGCGIDGMAGVYAESVCEGPGFAYKGRHPDTFACFLKGGDWRIYQTGCGWEVQHKLAPETEWERRARTYTGQCTAMPEEQYTVAGLTASTTYDGFGREQQGISLNRCPCTCSER